MWFDESDRYRDENFRGRREWVWSVSGWVVDDGGDERSEVGR